MNKDYTLSMQDDTINRQAAIDALCDEYCGGWQDCKYYPKCENLKAIQNLPSAQSEPAIPLSWIEGQIKWLKSLDNAFSTLTAGQISVMVNKWKDGQDG